jgi:Fe-S cluster assembly protein SufB
MPKGGGKSWDDVPDDIKNTFDRLGIPEAERKVLAGVGAQYESEVVYHSLKKEWADLGVIFEDMDMALAKYPDLVKKYFMKCVPANDHKFAALHGAVWSGGTFLYVPRGVKLKDPVQAYFRMNAPRVGQFEHTLIIVEEDAEVHYIEGCSAPKYDQSSLHAGCVEVFLKSGAKARYSSVENWSKNTYNLNTKRAIVDAHAHMEWVGGNMGSGVTMLYPASVLRGEGASCDHLGIAFANADQIQDTGAKIWHLAPKTKSNIVMKSLSKGGGTALFRGLIEVSPKAHGSVINSCCDALILDDISKSDTFPDIRIYNDDVNVMHEATAGNIKEDDIFYFVARGISEDDAKAMIVNGFISPIVKELPLEYAVEMNKLIELEMEGSVG